MSPHTRHAPTNSLKLGERNATQRNALWVLWFRPGPARRGE
jgi:hypothetical protein